MENVNFSDCNGTESCVSGTSFPWKQETVCNFPTRALPRLEVKAHFQVTALVWAWLGAL